MKKIKMNVVVEGRTVDEVFLEWAKILYEQNLLEDSRAGSIAGEVINATTVIKDPTQIMQNDVRKMSMRYAVGELLWYLSANKKISAIDRYSKVWKNFTDDGITVNSNYGYCIKYKYGFDQLEYVKRLLMRDKNTRQAVIHIKHASEEKTKDMNCTIALQFILRGGKLHLTTYMRSNDIWYGFPYDVFNFTALQILLAMELDVEIGTYTHVATSLHLYSADREKLKEAFGDSND